MRFKTLDPIGQTTAVGPFRILGRRAPPCAPPTGTCSRPVDSFSAHRKADTSRRALHTRRPSLGSDIPTLSSPDGQAHHAAGIHHRPTARDLGRRTGERSRPSARYRTPLVLPGRDKFRVLTNPRKASLALGESNRLSHIQKRPVSILIINSNPFRDMQISS